LIGEVDQMQTKGDVKDEKDGPEVTPEMVEAGVDVLWGFDRERDDPKEFATRVFRAMLLASHDTRHSA